MKVCVIGAGAMGCLYGGRLAQAGHDVTLFDLWAKHVQAINAGGLRLGGVAGERRISVNATTDAGELSGCSLAIVAVDANATREAARTLACALTADGFAFTLQNGIGNVEALAAELGSTRVVGGLSYHSVALIGPGHVAHTHAGATWLGEWGGGRTPRLEALAAMLAAAGLNPEMVGDIAGYIWDKWVLNCAINPLSAITGLRQGEIPRTPAMEEFQTRIIDEILAVIAAKGIKLHDPGIKRTIKDQCWKKFNKPSMLQHIEAGKRTEIDALNGAVVRLAAEVGVPVPMNEAITMLIKGREKASRQARLPSPVDYDALEAAAAREPRPGR